MAFENLYCLLAPLIVTHSVSGSLPNCSFVAPVVLATAPGTVMGMVVPHLFPPAVYTLTDSMLAPLADVVQVKLGRHRSRVWRLMNCCARSSCLRVLKGQVVLQYVSRMFIQRSKGTYRRIISAEITSIHVMSSEYWPLLPLTVVDGTSLTRMLAWWNMYLYNKSIWIDDADEPALTGPNVGQRDCALQCLES